MDVLGSAEQAEALEALPAWTFDPDARAIRRSWRFADFSQAFGFICRVALEAEKADHHPDWSNSWNRVEIALTTHSAGGLTALDIALAGRIDALAAALAPGGGGH